MYINTLKNTLKYVLRFPLAKAITGSAITAILCMQLGFPWNMSLTLAVFVLTVILVISEAFSRGTSALIGSSIMLIIMYLSGYDLIEFVSSSIEIETILILIGIMLIAAAGFKSGFLYFIGIKLAKISKGNPIRLYVILAIFVYILGYFLNYETIVAVGVSLAIAICSVMGINPRPYILMTIFVVNIAVSTALISCVPNIVVAATVKLDYGFFIANLAPITLVMVLIVFYITHSVMPPSKSVDPLRALAVVDMNPWLFVRSKLEFAISFASLAGFILGLLLLRTHGLIIATVLFAALVLATFRRADELLRDIDWDTIIFIMSFYLIVGGVAKLGILNMFAEGLLGLAGSNIFLLLTVLYWPALFISGLLEDLLYVLLLIPMLSQILLQPGFEIYREFFWILLILSCNVGGVMTTYSSPYNLIGLAIAKRAGEEISSKTFHKISKRAFSIVSVITYAYLVALLYFREYIGIGIALAIITMVLVIVHRLVGISRLLRSVISETVRILKKRVIKI
ncbi:MAG: SLC13 family permease [Crenarchaeota archaeon]|nr:SLC13 family permease [Thermoproteota archaeon]